MNLTESQQEMSDAVMWISIFFSLPLTVLFICCVCCAGQRNRVPVIYYTNLLISNIILICRSMISMNMPYEDFVDIIHCCAAMVGIYFKMCMALERYFFIACPLLDCLRQTQGSVLVCVLVWSFSIVSVTLAIILHESVRLIIYAALPAPLFIFCLAGTFKALPAATSVPPEENRRTVGTLVWLLLNYFLINLTAVVLLTLNLPTYSIELTLFVLSPLLDLILFAFKCKGPIDRLLACVCCSLENSRNTDVSDVSTERQVHVVRDKRREKTREGRDEESERDEGTPSSTNIVSE